MIENDDAGGFGEEMDLVIGRNLRRIREDKRISQAELARLATATGLRGFHQTTIARVESGQRSLRAAEALAIARALETNLDWLTDSEANSRLRDHVRDLSEASDRFRNAAGAVVGARASAADFLDATAPHGDDGLTRESILQSGLDPRLLDSLERVLLASSPEMILQTVLFHEVRLRRGLNGASGPRVLALLDEYEGSGGEHPAAPER